MPCLALFLLLLLSGNGFAQTPGASPGCLSWSASRRLEPSDFPRRVRPVDITQQSVAFQTGPAIVLVMLGRKEFKELGNRVVINKFCPAAVYLTPDHTQLSQDIRHYQTLWDIDEVTARRLRQQLQARARRHRLKKAAAEALYHAATEANRQRQDQYISETQSGRLSEKQQEWEQQLSRELTELAAFAVPD